MTKRQNIPDAALKKHIAILGMNGSGKTSVAKSEVIEPALEAGERVCNIDPTGVGWGLRLSATGKSKGFAIYIVGGEHADFPLFRRDGKAWAEIVGTSSDSFVFDTSQMTVEDRSQWFTDFAETLIRKNKGPLKLVLDEAHLFAPQGGSKSGGVAPKMLHATNNLLALGRSRGLRITMISQRPAKLHKDSLTQAHTLIAMALMAPQDREAVKAWIADQADVELGKEIIASLPSLVPGEGWIWAPKEHVLDRVRFSRPRTFDSSSAPEDADGEELKLAPINPDAIKAKLATVAKETMANDVPTLRKTISELQSETNRLKKQFSETSISKPDPAAIAQAEERGFERGKKEVAAAADARIRKTAIEQLEKLGALINPLSAYIADELKAAKRDKSKIGSQVAFTPTAVTRDPVAPVRALALPQPRKAPANANGGGDGTLPGSEQKIIDAIRWWNVLGIPAPSHAQVGFIAGYSHKSGTWSTYLSRLRSAGMIEGRGDLVLTTEGAAAANEPDAPPSGEQLRATVLAKVDGPLRKIMIPILDAYPQGLAHADAGELAGYSHQSGTWSTYLSRLRSLDLIDGRGELKAQNWLFP
jgi:hypothetical protein